jgi:aspartate/tyrosine/aromatic aminotransferase
MQEHLDSKLYLLNTSIGERVGCTFVVTKSKDIAKNCESMLERLQRSEVSNPPAYGAKIASHILNDSNLREMWYDDLVTMSSRIKSMRGGLYNLLIKNGKPSYLFTSVVADLLSRCARKLATHRESIRNVWIPWP